MSLDDDNNEINNSKKIFLINILKNLRMKKILFCSALAAVTLASCSSDDFMGDTPGSTPTSANSAIKFDGNAGKITRATSNSGTPEKMLDYQFKIYGVKSGAENKYSKVFEDYSIWWNTTLTTSNTNKWEYVGSGQITTGDNNQTNINLGSKSQTIKYWDYASDNYHFVAGSPISAFTYKLKEGTGDIESATITGLGGHITANSGTTATTFNPVYVAEPKVVKKANYKEAVKFNFVRQQSMVRVGIYETIPGYEITDIKFYKYDGNNLTKSTDKNIILTSATSDYFVGGKDVNGTINYNWEGTTPTYSFSYTGDYTKSKNWYAGAITGVKATTSAPTNISDLYGTDGDMDATNGYFIVMPTLAEQASAILIKCDYTLKSTDGSNEEIHVKGATAAIPAAYSKWDINTRYTYLFKISENTNGTTGDPNDPAGLYPITFDAAVTEMTDKTEGTTTTFTAPSITTYQKGSVEGNTIKYVANKDINVTVLNDKAEVQTLKTIDETVEEVGHIAVYKFDTKITEAEVQVKGVTGATAITGNVNNNVFTFKPTATGWYAIKYLAKAKVGTTPAVYTYKVVHVE